ncbi:unnamed protein product [Chondrus crispus]|uniref:Uncharacterized protein n=1 Tax=Chondrus crispus TaxID=2769 RepID=R7QGX7_CHOCR|nr:unnamed protein product [Chondrus crispus]CDF36726.1 unnamed protein product [Chondrus crispus]|eukprot:XP_005716545.1 unnamed protein product [Chondrus crispus]
MPCGPPLSCRHEGQEVKTKEKAAPPFSNPFRWPLPPAAESTGGRASRWPAACPRAASRREARARLGRRRASLRARAKEYGSGVRRCSCHRRRTWSTTSRRCRRSKWGRRTTSGTRRTRAR